MTVIDRETIELKLDEANELLFKVTIQGADATPARVRLVCEGGDISYMFDGHSTDDGEIRFIVPEMKNRLKEGETYLSRVEVLVENRYFSPVEFDMTFKQSMKVVAEGVGVNPVKKVSPEVVVQASIQKVARAAQETLKPQPIVTEPPKRQTLAEKFANKFTEKVSEPKKSVTGLDDKTMEEVARSNVRRLLGK